LQYVALLADVGPLRPNGFKAEIKKLPGAQIVATQDAWLAADAERVTTDILNAHPDIDVIWAANEGGTVGAVTAVKNAGKAGKVVVFGTDMSEQIAGFLLSPDNILQAVTGQKPYEMGYQAVESAVKVLNGEKVKKQQILTGVLFTRDKPAGVQAFQQQVQKLSS
jgi:ABC-type sugar transport system substrate-binding protein